VSKAPLNWSMQAGVGRRMSSPWIACCWMAKRSGRLKPVLSFVTSLLKVAPLRNPSLTMAAL
jgi:hypothetical protein